jgi:uncharacterized protein (DUF736 family)
MKIGIGIKNPTTGVIELNVIIPFAKAERISLQRNETKQGSQPDFLAFLGMERCGAMWKKTSTKGGQTFLSGNLESPVFPGGTIDVALFAATDENRKGEYDLTWRPGQRTAQSDPFNGQSGGTHAGAAADDGDDIPF